MTSGHTHSKTNSLAENIEIGERRGLLFCCLCPRRPWSFAMLISMSSKGTIQRDQHYLHINQVTNSRFRKKSANSVHLHSLPLTLMNHNYNLQEHNNSNLWPTQTHGHHLLVNQLTCTCFQGSKWAPFFLLHNSGNSLYTNRHKLIQSITSLSPKALSLTETLSQGSKK